MKNKRRNWLIGGSIAFVVLFIALMTWFYPFSPFSFYKNYTYKPTAVLYNNQTYAEMMQSFKKSYDETLNEELEKDVDEKNGTIIRMESIFQVFGQDWLVNDDSVKMDKVRIDEMLSSVEQWKLTLLSLLAQEDYTKEERILLVDAVNNTMVLEEHIRYLKEGKYFSRKELNISLGNLRHQFQRDFEIFMTTFYDEVKSHIKERRDSFE